MFSIVARAAGLLNIHLMDDAANVVILSAAKDLLFRRADNQRILRALPSE